MAGTNWWKFYVDTTSNLKKVCQKLSMWSREVFGDIYKEPKRLETRIENLENALVVDNSASKRAELNKVKAEYVQFLKLQEGVLQAKGKVQLAKRRGKSTTYFRSVIKGKRKKLNIQRIQDDSGNWREGGQEIASAAIDHFQRIFFHNEASEDMSALDCIEPGVSIEDNKILTTIPTMDKVKDDVFFISLESAPGPDGLSAFFYQTCWSVISEDVYNVVVDFFQGETMPRFFAHTFLVLLLKVDFN
ncbi:PREDICTED: uncharacterized protein LOC109214516 [Nicotiana attenuata]|uniref:uncharacterized protein LOC109214516 n=1 Tax=Nicotiana attenuata TaxID=49451 RepID=UPI000904E824|nr:PREDICTED: uncharacterized protein LOC109214516 [Nicotiana attenuata]